jgi:hypothetical protein
VGPDPTVIPISPVVDYAAKLALATPVSGTTGARDAIAAVKAAIREAERLLGHSLLQDCIDPLTGEIAPLTIVTDNGPAYKSTDFALFIAGRPELAHVRTRHHSPETNGVVERFNGSIKYEHLYRLEIPDAVALADEAEAYRRLYNEVRPHESLDFATPLSRYLKDPLESHLFRPKVSKNLDAGHLDAAAALAGITWIAELTIRPQTATPAKRRATRDDRRRTRPLLTSAPGLNGHSCAPRSPRRTQSYLLRPQTGAARESAVEPIALPGGPNTSYAGMTMLLNPRGHECHLHGLNEAAPAHAAAGPS